MSDEQLTFNIQPLNPVTGETLQERFWSFHTGNPWVYEALEKMAADLASRGRRRIGVKMLAEVIRWNYARQTSDTSPFKLNNSYVSRYSRLLLEAHPEWSDLIEVRELRAA